MRHPVCRGGVRGRPDASAAACESLARSLSLPNTTVTLSQAVGAGKFVPPGGGAAAAQAAAALPAFCRVTLTIAPSPDSDIRSEVWLPMSGWNGKFLQVGNGAWGGSIQYGPLGDALRRGYAAASTDTGHTGTDASFAMGHPEKLIDFGYRSVHETAVQGKATAATLYGEGPASVVFQRVLGRRPDVLHGGPALSRRFRRHHRGRARIQPDRRGVSDARHGAGDARQP